MTTTVSEVRTASSHAWALRSLAALPLAGVLVWWLVPRASGAAWSTLATALSSVTTLEILLLSALWFAGLVVHSFVLKGALPGLSTSRALTLNLTGSAVASVAPMGGALGVATNLAMTRRWRFRDRAFAVFTVVTNLWDVLAKLALPVVALVALLLAGTMVPPALAHAAVLAAASLAGVLVLVVAMVASDRVARGTVRAAVRLSGRTAPRLVGPVQRGGEHLVATLADSRELVRSTWGRLSLGMAGYVALQAVLLGACLHLTGAPVAVTTVLAAFAVERLLSLALITPGGAGFAEAATIATLVALGGEPVGVAAGVLLYRAFIVVVEIPVGGVWLGGWLLGRSWPALRDRRRGAVE